ncbi:MAG: YbaK/EbsC family protein [Burkholderiales bacterium]|nr:YbaK/EbsC family protein [Burkholderiales bacterium]
MREKVLANASVKRVVAALDAAGIATEIIVTEEATPSSQAAAVKHGCDVAQIAKSVIFRGLTSDRVVLVITSGANRVDEARVVEAIGEAIGRADAAFVKERTGFSIGGVAPLGHLQAPITLFDETLLAFEVIYPAAGHPNTGFAVAPRALAEATAARVLVVA